jgi:hypothetical protein
MKHLSKIVTLLFFPFYISGQVNPSKYSEDVTSIDNIIASMYDVISGPAVQRDWNRFHHLYHPNAYMMAIYASSDSTFSNRIFTPQEYVKRSDEMMRKNAFNEIELNRRTEQFGNLVNVFSAYEFTTPTLTKTGINSLQLFFDGSRWWIMSIIWQESSPNLPLPEWVK